jgi:ATP-dependent DNA helicase RecG
MRKRKGRIIKPDDAVFAHLQRNAGFNLTVYQKKALNEIVNDIVSDYNMRRLLQGDVGSGKTIVAFMAAVLVAKSGWQSAFMVYR